MARLTIRIDLSDGASIGPGKIALLEAVADHGSIAAAARSLNMSYARAWRLVAALNEAFADPVVTRRPGGVRGGGATLTAFGRRLIRQYRQVERAAQDAAAAEIAGLEAHQAGPGRARAAGGTESRPVSRRRR